MHISLTPKLEEIVKNKVQSGLYNNASEVMREALRHMFEQDQINKMKLKRLREELLKAEEQLDRGESSEYSFEKIIKKLDKKK